MNIRTSSPLVIIGIIVAMGSCSSECYDNQNALPLAKFSNALGGELQLDSVEVFGIGAPGDSILWEGGATNSLYLPFRVDSDTTAYVFRTLPADSLSVTVSDTVTFIYDRAPRFVSAECGVSYVYKIRDIKCTGELIDSVVCPGGEITNANVDNLIIYLRDE